MSFLFEIARAKEDVPVVYIFIRDNKVKQSCSEDVEETDQRTSWGLPGRSQNGEIIHEPGERDLSLFNLYCS